MRFDELALGQSAEISKTIQDADIETFGALTGDRNPVHFDDAWAKETRFGGRIAHGLLTTSLLSAVLGMHLPGTGAIYRSQSLRFRAPVFPGDTITARVEVLELRPERRQVRLATTITNQRGEVVIDGSAEMLMLE